MNGLEEIVLNIKQKAEQRSAEIDASAKAKAEEIINNAQIDAKAESDKAAALSEKKCVQIAEAANAAAQSEKSKEILRFKSQTVEDVLKDAVKSLCELETEQYFNVLEKLVLSNFHKNEKGEICFSKIDTKRVDDKFLSELNGKLKKEGAELTIGKAADIKNGFILRYGDIEENCSFDAIVNAKQDILRDKIAEILFKSAEAKL